MSREESTAYWLFQSSPDVFRLPDALRQGSLATFALRAHRERVKAGDRVILWQTGREAGCYALATVADDPAQMEVAEEEAPFFQEPPAEGLRVSLRVDFNCWNQPITMEMLRDLPAFDDFNAGLPGTNYQATYEQYRALEDLICKLDLALEPKVEYQTPGRREDALNLILYGPPGTGKTFQTINHALSIIENRPLSELALEDRQELRRRFYEYLGRGQVAFVTFHQSFSYEDFVEGIKPRTQGQQVVYEIEDGIFKLICQDARRCLFEAFLRELPLPPRQWEFNQLYSSFLEHLRSEQFQFFLSPSQRRIFLQRVLPFGNLSVRRARSFSVQTVQRSHLQRLYENLPVSESPEITAQVLSPRVSSGDSRAYWAVFKELKQFESRQIEAQYASEPDSLTDFELPLVPEAVLDNCRRYVLIIDEINRGNVPAIFGDLISLLEPDKREGRREALSLNLPYSKSVFAIPPNLHLIGTMNTTDRSVETLDVALRRRFAFREMRPQPELIRRLSAQPVAAGVDLARLLATINARLERLLDREHCLGHAYFLNIYSLADLRRVFREKVIPQLQEFFYHDYGRIGLVLGREFVREKTDGRATGFADFNYPFAEELADQPSYELCPVHELDEGSFIRIYDPDYR